MEKLEQQILLKYGAVESFVQEQFVHTPKGRVRPQIRRYILDEAVATVGGAVHQTTPRGEHYITLDSGDIVLSHVETASGKNVRRVAHRKALSKHNALLEPVQPDFFDEKPVQISGKLNVVIVVVHPEARLSEQTVPEAIMVSVPYSSWLGYHLWIPLSEFLAMYHEEHQYEEDIAWPTLRIALEGEEESTKSG